MQNNTPITPAAADVGAALAQAILAVLENPKAARAAAEEKLSAMQMTEEEIARLEEDKKFMADAAEWRQKIREFEDYKNQKQEQLDSTRAKLGEDQDVHTTNVERFNESVALHNDDYEKHDQDKKTFYQQKKSFTTEWQALLDGQEQLKIDQADVERRENILAGLSQNLKKSA